MCACQQIDGRVNPSQRPSRLIVPYLGQIGIKNRGKERGLAVRDQETFPGVLQLKMNLALPFHTGVGTASH